MGSASWTEVQEHLRGRYRLQKDEAQSFLLGFAVGPPGNAEPAVGESLIQGVHGQHLVVEAREFVLLRAEVCSDRALDPLAALQHSAKLVLGALVLLGVFPLIARKIIDGVQARKVYARFEKPARFDRNLVVIGAGSAGLVSAYIAAAVQATAAPITWRTS